MYLTDRDPGTGLDDWLMVVCDWAGRPMMNTLYPCKEKSKFVSTWSLPPCSAILNWLKLPNSTLDFEIGYYVCTDETDYHHSSGLKSPTNFKIHLFQKLKQINLKVGQVKKNYTSHLTLILKFVFGGCFLFAIAIFMLAVRNIWLRLCDL